LNKYRQIKVTIIINAPSEDITSENYAIEKIANMTKEELTKVASLSIGKEREDNKRAHFILVDAVDGLMVLQKNEQCFIFKFKEDEDEEEFIVDLEDSRYEFDEVMGKHMCYIDGGGVGGGYVECDELSNLEIATQIHIHQEGL